jgi:hypothetical protein
MEQNNMDYILLFAGHSRAIANYSSQIREPKASFSFFLVPPEKGYTNSYNGNYV